MSTYVVSDIHGQLELFKSLVGKLNLDRTNDILYILGDYVDWGPNSIGVIEYIMELQREYNVIPLMGNHDHMMLSAIRSINDKDDTYKIKNRQLKAIVDAWWMNGGVVTFEEYKKLDEKRQTRIREWLSSLKYTVDISVNNREFHLCHAHPKFKNTSNFDVIWDRTNPNLLDKQIKLYMPGKTVICGHTIVNKFGSISSSGKCEIYEHSENLIYIDCGAKVYGEIMVGRLVAMRLEDGKREYVG